MKISIEIFCIITYITTAVAQRTSLDNPILIGKINIFRRILYNTFESNARSRKFAKALDDKHIIQDVVDDSVPFPCSLEQPRSKEKPTSVHKLRPGDIDVIGAMGDSLTAGVGALSLDLVGLYLEHRGVSFSIGGQGNWRKYTTVPNILKAFNPNIIGYALATSPSIDKKSQFNVAESGAMSSDLPYMAKVLVKRIINDKRVNLASDWKMISICMGANDFCSEVCYERNPEDILVKYKRNLITTLRILRDNLPRTFVNIISAPNVNLLKEFTALPDTCQLTHRIDCPCFIGEYFKPLAQVLTNVIYKWRELEQEIVNYDEFNKDDFTAVIQPLFKELVLPRTPAGNVDSTYFALDCFHFSQKGHALVATAIWNNLVSSENQKQTTIISKNFKCPTQQNPYLFTKRNSFD